MSPSTDPTLPDDLAPFAVRAAHEGVPVCATARILHRPAEEVFTSLKTARSLGQIFDIPKSDWPPTAKLSDRLPTVPRTLGDDDLHFICQQFFKLTKLEASFLVILLKFERVDKAKLHNVVEQQRFARAMRPDKTEPTDPKMVDVMICKLRKKLRGIHENMKIETIWGGGYYVEPAVKTQIMQHLGGTNGTTNGSGPAVARGCDPADVGPGQSPAA